VRALIALLAITVVSAVSAANAPIDAGCAPKWWPQSRQSACSSGSATDPAAPSPANVAGLDLAWTYRAAGAVGEPIVSAGPAMRRVPLVYVVGSDRRLHALELATGRPRWSARAGGTRGTAVADRDLLLRLGDSGVLRRYVPRSGHIVWQRAVYPTEGRFPPRPVVSDGMLFVRGDFDLRAIDARTGRQLWDVSDENGAPEVAAAGGRVYVTGDPDMDAPKPVALHAVDARTGHEVWSTRIVADWGAAPVLAAGRLFVRQEVPRSGEHRFSIHAFRASDGEPLWQAPVGSHDRFWFTPPAADATLVVCASEDGHVYGLDAASGALRWRTEVGFSGSSPAIVNGLVWTGDGEGRLTALDAASGRRLWTSPRVFDPGESAIEPVVAGGFVLVGTADGLLAYHVPAASG
jgi:outer membrane protein assembly factor BamB